MLLVSALVVGPSIKPLKAATDVPWALVQSTSYYLRRGKVWVGGTMHYPWLEPLIEGEFVGEIGFDLDVMVGAGYVSRRLTADDEPEYQMAQWGEDILSEPSGMSVMDWHAQHARSYNIPKWPNRPPTPAKEDTRGKGKIRCLNCGNPTRDHSITGPCPPPPAALVDSRTTVR